MSVELDDLSPSAYEPQRERQPGEFRRRGENGPPYIAAPDGEKLKRRKKKGEVDLPPKMVLYSRPSSFGDLIEDKGAIEKWLQRQIVLGIGSDPLLGVTARELVGGDIDDKVWRGKADALVRQALDTARADLAAARGTVTHGNVEDSILARDPALHRLAGENLGMSDEVQQSLVDIYHATIEAHGIKILATELSVVNDEFRAAGKLDNLGELTRPLRFRMATGEIVEIPAGTVLVLDTKTGKLRREGVNEDGPPMYWEGYAIQLWLYADSVIYDPDTDTRIPFERKPSLEHALIVHLDNLAALRGEPKCELVYVDLAQGRRGCETVVAAKEFHRSKTMFSVAEAGAQPEPETATVIVCGGKNAGKYVNPNVEMTDALVELTTTADEALELAAAWAEEPTIPIEETPDALDVIAAEEVEDILVHQQVAAIEALLDAKRQLIQARMDALKEHSLDAARTVLGQMKMHEIPTLKQSADHTEAQLDWLDTLVMQAAANFGVPFGPPFDITAPAKPGIVSTWTANVDTTTTYSLTRAIVEGPDLAEHTAKAITAAYLALPDWVRSQCALWKSDAATAGYSANLNEIQSVRRFAVTRAMMSAATLLVAITDPAEGEPLLRRIVLVVTGEQFAANSAIPMGVCLAVLGDDEADRFCDLAHLILQGVRRGAATLDDDLAAAYHPPF